MKTLKLDHELAQQIADGQKTSTWRINDEKDISVNDEVQLIDKVDAHNRSTWRPIGVATVDTVVQKRVGELTLEDMEGHEKYGSIDSLLEVFRGYYGSGITEQTPIKLISFTFRKVKSIDNDVFETTPKVTEVKLYGDGGSRGNPGPSASGYVLFDMSGNELVRNGAYLGVTTNNQAEYLSLKLGLEHALKYGAQIVHVHMDSLLVVNQMTGKFRVKNRDLWPIYTSVKELLPKFKKVTFVHVPRALNKEADAVVNEVLDKEESSQTAMID